MRFNCSKRISMGIKRRAYSVESNDSSTEKREKKIKNEKKPSKRKRVWRVESVGDNFTTPSMSRKRRKNYCGPLRHKWTAEQELLVIRSYIQCLDSDSKRPDYMRMMTWSEINGRAIEYYRLMFGHKPYVTAATIKYKVKWLRDVYDRKDTSNRSRKKFREFMERHKTNESWEDYQKLINHPRFRLDRESRSDSFLSSQYTSTTCTPATTSSTSKTVTSKDPAFLEARAKFNELKNVFNLEEDIYYSVYPKLLDEKFRILFLDCETYDKKLHFVRSYFSWNKKELQTAG